MRLSLVGSTAWFGCTYSSSLPLPLVSMTTGAQPWAFASSPVSSQTLRFTQPMAPCCGPPALTHTVLSASSASTTWWVLKQVRTSLVVFDLGSYIARWRVDSLSGNALADG